MVNIKQMVSEPIIVSLIIVSYIIIISYNNFDLCQVSKVAAHFQNKSKMFIYLFKHPNKESGKILKNKAAEPYLKPYQIFMMEHSCETSTAKSFIIDKKSFKTLWPPFMDGVQLPQG